MGHMIAMIKEKVKKQMAGKFLKTVLLAVLACYILPASISAVYASQEEAAEENNLAEAKIGDDVYATVQEIFDKFRDGTYTTGTITLLRDIDLEDSIDVFEGDAPSDITLDLNGMTVNGKGSVLKVYDNSVTLTIQDSSADQSGRFYGKGAAGKGQGIGININGGTVFLKSGTFSGDNYGVFVYSSDPKLYVCEDAVISGVDEYGEGCGLNILSYDGRQPLIQLSGGIIYGGRNAIYNSVGTLKDLLDTSQNQNGKYYAYFNGNDPVTEGLDQHTLYGVKSVTVGECTHPKYRYHHTAVTTTHSKLCCACGKLEVENCTFDERGNCSCTASLIVNLSNDTGIIYDGTAHTPGVTVTLDGQKLEAAKYVIDYKNNINAGEASVCVKGKDELKFEQTVKFQIAKAALTESRVTISEESAVYNGTEQKPAVVVSGLMEGTDYEIAYDTNDFTNAGNRTITVTGKGNYGGCIEKMFTIEKAPLVRNGDGTASGIYGKKLSELEITGLTVTNLQGAEITGIWRLTDDAIPDVDDGGPYTAVFTPENGAENYKQLSADVRLNISKAQGILHVPETSLSKKYGADHSFLLNFTIEGDGAVICKSNDETVVKVLNSKEAFIQGTGDAVITVSLAEGKNYLAAPDKEIHVHVAKGDAPDLAAETRCYTSVSGSGGEAAIDIAQKLPADRGNTEYHVTKTDTGYLLSDLFVDADGKLLYTVAKGQPVGSKATVTVKAVMKNYEYTEFTVTIEIVEKIEVRFTAAAQDGVYDGRPHNGFSELSAETVNGSYLGSTIFKYEGTGETSYSGSEPPVLAGSYTVTICVPDSEAEYTGTSHALPFCIQKAAVKIKADDKTAKAGSSLPEFTYMVTGLVGNEQLAAKPQFSCSANMKTAGSYPIMPNGAQVPNTDNYKEEIIYENGMLTVYGSSTSSSGSTSSGSSTSGSGSISGSGSFGGSVNTGGTNTKKPFLKDRFGREGWEVIQEEAKKAANVPQGGTVVVDMNGIDTVPSSILEAIRGSNVTITFDMGGGILWSINGKDIAPGAVADSNLSVRTEKGAIPESVINRKAGSLAHLELSLAHEGAFGFTASLMLRIGSDGNGIAVGGAAAEKYTGMYANLFYYDPVENNLEFVCAGKIGEDGTVRLLFEHASDYTVILSLHPMGEIVQTPEKSSETQNSGNKEKPDSSVPLKAASVKLSKTVYTYNGKAKKPSVTAIDAEGRRISGKYYTIRYQNNKKVGKAAVIVKWKAPYYGTIKKEFTIRPAAVSVKKITAAPGGFTVKWRKKKAQTSGYQIQYSENRSWKGSSTHSKFVKDASVTSRTVKNLEDGKTYYVRIRAYKTVKKDGKSIHIYSAWSKPVKF